MENTKGFKIGFQEGNRALQKAKAEETARSEEEKRKQEQESARKERFYQEHGYADVVNPPQSEEKIAELKAIKKDSLKKLENPAVSERAEKKKKKVDDSEELW